VKLDFSNAPITFSLTNEESKIYSLENYFQVEIPHSLLKMNRT